MNKKINIKDNMFSRVYVDITFKCNMKCNVCYTPWDNPGINLCYFEDVCKKIKGKVIFRFMGGEPTMDSKKLFRAMQIAHKYNHLIAIPTNGMKISNINFAKKLINLKIPFNIGMSFDGGLDNEIYFKINGELCKDKKLKAIKNMNKLKYKNVTLTATIIKNVNEHIIPDLFKVAKQYKMIKSIHFRTQIKYGKYINESTYSMVELESLVSKYIPEWNDPLYIIHDGKTTTKDKICLGCCKNYFTKSKIQIELIDAGNKNIRKCHLRGHLNNDYTLTPVHEYVYQQIKGKIYEN